MLQRIDDGRLCASVAGVVSDRADAFGLQRALEFGLDTRVLKEPSQIWSWLFELDVDLVLLAGYLRLLPIVPDFEGRVLNIHPALLPRHGGKGMYGERVHAAVIAAGETESGCTVHLCDGEYDHGRILMQARVPVRPDDTATTLGNRVLAAEFELYPAAIGMRWAELSAD
ncbi:MAG: phosphoribosylglycinamide formyltransferase [Planctomycetes bacterium]|nr:phosphoribosylglycinamide formyltransferase [Planctomycetota bacterium]